MKLEGNTNLELKIDLFGLIIILVIVGLCGGWQGVMAFFGFLSVYAIVAGWVQKSKGNKVKKK